MIGTTFKLGFDGTSVKRGLGGLSRGLGRLGKQFALGGVRQAGARVTDLMGRIFLAAPRALKETADWAGGMTDMATQTGVSVEELILLEEKMRLAGATARDSSKMISQLADSLYEASTEGGPAKDALNDLGFFASEFRDMPIDDAFNKLGERVAELGPEFKGLETAMADLFGARMGFGMIRLFRNIEEETARAKNNVGQMAKQMGAGQAQNLDRFADSLGRFENFKRSLSTIALDQIFRSIGGPGGMDRIFDFLNPEKIRPQIESLVTLLGRNLEVFMSQDLMTSLGDVMKNLGKKFGEGIKENFQFDVKSLIPFGLGASNNSSADPIGELKRQTTLLADIARTNGVSRFT